MKFRTEYTPTPSRLRLDPERPLLMLGSCFSDNVGSYLSGLGWDVAVNPCGTIFNPATLSRLIDLALQRPSVRDPRTANIGDKWFSWDFPTAFTFPAGDELRTMITEALDSTLQYIRKAQCVILSLGTSIVYNLADDPIPVANCHKRPSSLFSRRMLSTEEITRLMIKSVEGIRSINPGVPVILTVSPVRHIKEGFAANSRSKARLLLACENLENDGVAEYFPSFEILTDDLRDYRYYAEDLLHPTDAASGYIATHFLDTFMDSEGQELLRRCGNIRRRLSHRILNPRDPDCERFIKETNALAREFREAHPAMKLD